MASRLFKLNGIVLRTVKYGESDLLLTVLDPQHGKVLVSARGARSSPSSKFAFCSHILFYGEFTVYERGGKMWLREASSVRDFYNVDMGIKKLSLAAYILDVLCDITVEGQSCVDIFTLALNIFHVLTSSDKPPELIKAVFEFRCMGESGFASLTDACMYCHERGSDGYLNISDLSFICSECLHEGELTSEFVFVPSEVCEAINYVLSCPQKRIFAFSVSENSYQFFYTAAESFLLTQTERTFDSLLYYKSI